MGKLVGPIAPDENGVQSILADDGPVPCDGRALSREEYPRLFAKIGTHYGAGDGETTFNVPDLRPPLEIDADLVAEAKAKPKKRAPKSVPQYDEE